MLVTAVWFVTCDARMQWQHVSATLLRPAPLIMHTLHGAASLCM